MPYYKQVIHHKGGIIRQRGLKWQAEINAGSRRKRKSFDKLSNAKFWVNTRRKEIRKSGMDALRLTEKQRLEAYEAIKILGQTPLLTAANYYLKHHRPGGQIKTVNDFYADFLAAKTKAGLRPDSLRSIRQKIGSFARDFGNKNLHEISATDLDSWMDKMGHTEITRQNSITYFKSLFNYAIKQKLIEHNPAKDLERPKIDETLPEAFAVEDVEKLFAMAKKSYQTIIPWLAIGFFAGLRSAELKGLKWTDINMAEKIITVRPEVAKRRRQRHVTVTDNLSKWLASYVKPSGKVVPPDITRRRRLIKLLEETGVKWIHNGMRHSFASYHLMAFSDPGRTSLELGHSGLPTVLFNYYRGLVKREEAERYWKILP